MSKLKKKKKESCEKYFFIGSPVHLSNTTLDVAMYSRDRDSRDRENAVFNHITFLRVSVCINDDQTSPL